ncbi:MAG: hypothetical protein ACK4GL_10595, partial [Flavobacteriales bacterium]
MNIYLRSYKARVISWSCNLSWIIAIAYTLLYGQVAFTQNAIVGTGFSSGWGGSCPSTGNGGFSFMSASAGGTWIVTRNANGTGNQFWRFGIDWGGTTHQRTQVIGSDVDAVPSTTYTLNPNCTNSGAIRYNVPNTSYNYVFKTLNAGTNPTGTWVFFEVQGDVRTANTVSQLPLAANVSPHAEVTVTANMSGIKSTGQEVYLRYTNNNYATSTVVQMNYIGTTATATIPASFNTAGANISYYVFTSGPSNVATNGSNADLYTINLNNNGGPNYTYTVGTGWTTASAGNWDAAATWTAGVVPPTTLNMGTVNINHNVTGNADALFSALNVNGSNTLSQNSGIVHTTTGGVTINGAATYTVNGTLRINSGGFVNATGTLNYGSSSTLNYNSGGNYGASNEWITNTMTGQRVPQNVTISNNTSVNFGASNQYRQAIGHININAGSTLVLSTAAGGDLRIGGDMINAGTLTHNNRSVTFNGTTAQSANSAAITYRTLIIANTSANVTAGANITIASGGALTVNASARLDMAANTLILTGTTSVVNGFLRSSGTITGANATTLTISGTGTFEHNYTGTTAVPTATWSAGSTCAIIGTTTSGGTLGGLAQSFHHFTVNMGAGSTQSLNAGGNLTTVNGDLTVSSTGSAEFRLTATTSPTINIGGNLNVSGGTLALTNGTGTPSINLLGNFNQSGGAITRASSTGTINLVRTTGVQTLSQTAGTVMRQINWNIGNGSTTNTVALLSNLDLSASTGTGGTFAVLNNASLDFSTYELTGTNVTFNANSGSTLITANTNGFAVAPTTSGSVQTTTRIFNSGANFTYNGSSAQVTGSAATSVNRLEIDNSAGVSLSTNLNTNLLELSAGLLTLGTHHLTVNSTSASAINGQNATRYIVTNSTGELRRAIATSGLPINYEFPIGTASAYTPTQFNFTANSAARNLHVRTVGNRNPNDVTVTDYINNRYWVTDLSNNAGTYNYTSQFTFLPGDVVGSASNIRLNRWNGTAWNQPGGSSIVGNNLVSGSMNQSVGNLAATSEWAGRVVGPQNYTWLGSISSSWDDPDNWDLGTVPGNPLDNITIPSSFTNELIITGTRSSNNFTVSPSATFSLAATATLTVNGNYVYNSSTAATFACNSSLVLSSSSSQNVPAADYGNLNIAGGPRVLASSGTIRICGNYTPTAGTLTTTGSTVEFNGTSAQSILTNITSFNILNITNTVANVTSTVNVTVSNQLNVSTNARFDFGANTLTITGATATINGFLRSAGTITGASATTLIFTATGTYEHNHPQSGTNLGTIPTANWNVGSTCAIIGLTNPTAGAWFNPAASAAQSFSNFTWNTPLLTTIPNMNGATLNVGGTFTMASTGTASLRLGTNSSGIINCGNYEHTGGTIDMSAGTGNGTISASGNFNHSGGIITESGSGTSHLIRFNGTASQAINFGGTISNDINFELDNAAGFNISGTAPVASNRSVTRVSGDITGTGSFNYSAIGTSLVFNSSTNFNTSNADFPASNGPVNLIINSGAQVSLHADRSLPANGTLTLNSGRLILGANNLSLLNNNAAAITGTFTAANMVITDGSGRLLRTIATAGLPITYTWPVGENTGVIEYSPVSITFTANSTARQIGFNVVDVQHPENNNPLPQTNYISRYWTASNSAAGSYSYTGVFTYMPADINGTESLIKVNQWNGAGWIEATSTAAANQLTITGTQTQATLPFGATAEFSGRVNPILYFQSVASGNWNTTATWEVADNPGFTGAAAATFAPNSSNSAGIWVRNGHTVTVSTVVNADELTVDAGGILSVSAAGNFTITDAVASTDFVANGTFNVAGICAFSAGAGVELNDQVNVTSNNFTSLATVSVGGSAVYNHNVNGGSIVTATWNAGSKLEITGITSSNLSGGLGQLFWDVEWNCPNQSQAINVAAAPFNTIANDFIVTNTNGFELRFFSGNTGGTVTINRDLIVNGGLLSLASGASVSTSTVVVNVGRNVEINAGQIGTGGATNTTASNLTFNIAGNLLLDGGNLNFLPGSFTITANHVINLSGNLTINSGQILRTGTLTATFRFNRTSGAQSYSANAPATAISTNTIGWQVGNGTSAPVLNLINNFAMNASSTLTVQNGARLNCADYIVTGGTFTMNSGSALGIGSPAGIVTAPTAAGNIQTTTRNYHLSNGSYYYMGSVDQVTGNALPNTASNNIRVLGIETSNGARVTQNTASFVTVSNTLQLTSGIYILTNTDLRLTNLATVGGTPSASAMIVNTGTSRYNGRLMRLYPSGSHSSTFTFPVGDIVSTAEYSPVTFTVNYSGATSPPYIAIKCVDAKHPQDPSIDDYLTRYWESTANWYSGTGTVSAQFNYLPADIVGTESNIKHNRFSWSGPTAGNFFEDAASFASGNVLTSVAMPLNNMIDH